MSTKKSNVLEQVQCPMSNVQCLSIATRNNLTPLGCNEQKDTSSEYKLQLALMRRLEPKGCTLNVFWTLDIGHWTLDIGHWTLDIGHWTLDFVLIPGAHVS